MGSGPLAERYPGAVGGAEGPQPGREGGGARVVVQLSGWPGSGRQYLPRIRTPRHRVYVDMGVISFCPGSLFGRRADPHVPVGRPPQAPGPGAALLQTARDLHDACAAVCTYHLGRSPHAIAAAVMRVVLLGTPAHFCPPPPPPRPSARGVYG